MSIRVLVTALFFGSLFAQFALADGPRKRNIEFEDGVVEGMNHKSLDSLNHVGERVGGDRKVHLYKLRTSFDDEMRELSHEAEYGL